MLTNIAFQSMPQAGVLRATALSATLSRPVVASLHKSRHGQQTRSYRFGMWSSYIDPEFQRDLRRRHRMIKHKYAETINRRLKWDHGPIREDTRAILRRVVGRYCHPANVYTSRVSSNGSAHWYGKYSNGQTADDGRVNASSSNSLGSQFDTWKSELDNIVNSWANQADKFAKRAHSTSASQTSGRQQSTATNGQGEEEYVFDPITNRKVLKKSYGSFENEAQATPAKTFKSYRSQFGMFAPPGTEGQTPQQPVHSDGPPPPAELTKYNDVDVDTATDRLAALDFGAQIQEYSLNHLPPEEAAEIREDVDKYNPSEYDQVSTAPESHTQKYDDLHKYKPSEYDQVQAASEGPVEKYDDLHKYNAYRYNEAATSAMDPPLAYDDLHKYRPYEHNETAQAENSATQYEDLEKYADFEHDKELKTNEAAEKYEDLDKYRPHKFSERDEAGQSAVAYEDLDKYHQPFHHEEGKATPEAQQEYDDLDKYQPNEFDDPVEKPFGQYGDLDKYKAFRFQEPDGKAVLEKDIVDACLKESDAKSETREHLEQSLSKHIAASDAADREAIANLKISRQNSKSPGQSSTTGNFVRDFPEEFSSRWRESANGLHRETNASEQELESRVQSAEKSFSESLSRNENAAVLQSALDRQPKSRLEIALRRSRRMASRPPKSQPEIDPYSRPGPMETSYAEECGAESASPSYVRNYGSFTKPVVEPKRSESISAVPLEQLVSDIPSQLTRAFLSSTPTTTKTSSSSSSSPSSSSPSSPQSSSTSSSSSSSPSGVTDVSTEGPPTNPHTEPTIYKILAYDPTMQNVSIAETTSVVPDQASPLTPAEVLLRLSNPVKFFPHFAPLQAQGFEIVSGSGDVLVFRKTREIASPMSSPVNPIDMMGRSILSSAAAFSASPTGFVNYDTPQTVVVEEDKPGAFRSNIDVRREEPVFSGPKTSSGTQRVSARRKKSVTKRILIGGISVAGLSYALGVMGEYFATGGMDGKGPTGF